MKLPLASTEFCSTLASDDASAIINALGDNLIIVIVFGVGGILGVMGIVFGTISSTANRKEREKTKRELAAYVAEGSMTPQDAERILQADREEE
ncbi:MAG: hypothetical protein JJ974_01535 [Phycisphaerales bacterium]|nr:hypothetical protein [Phycisphaerales bacterium]